MLINRPCSRRADLTFVQGHVGRVEVHQAADVSLVAEIGRRLVLPGLRGRICKEGESKQGRLNRENMQFSMTSVHSRPTRDRPRAQSQRQQRAKLFELTSN